MEKPGQTDHTLCTYMMFYVVIYYAEINLSIYIPRLFTSVRFRQYTNVNAIIEITMLKS